MTPSAEPASVPASGEVVVPSELLEKGEVVILAIKPSGWYVLLSSWPGLVVAAGIAAVAYFGPRLGISLSQELIYFFCVAVVLLRIMLASFHWLGRLYVLTDRRVLRIRGVFRVDVFQCPLKQIMRTDISASLGERIFTLGTLIFETAEDEPAEGAWINVARPEEVQQLIEEAIAQAR